MTHSGKIIQNELTVTHPQVTEDSKEFFSEIRKLLGVLGFAFARGKFPNFTQTSFGRLLEISLWLEAPLAAEFYA